jgi:2-polyprenyl-6-methoxyphenol hydroxylase-like FAD-dependent oxidoreductase
LWTALLLAEGGVEVSIIDREQRTAARSYACALHPRTLKLLQRLGLAEAVLERGRRVSKMAFYEQESRRAEIDLSELGGEFPFLLILPQNALEEVLEQRLRGAGVNVRWNHRFDGLDEEEETVTAAVEELAGTATGYIVPHWETIVKDRWPIRSHFLIGADGHQSLVRQRLRIDTRRVAGPEYFVAYEFRSDHPAAEEVRVVLDRATTNVLWPLPGNKSRWTFQLVHSELSGEFPEKERRAVRPEQPSLDERMREYVQRAAKHRAPWFTAGVEEIAWCSGVVFEHQLALEFGRNRCWLVGDAAHQTGPVGVQSMNEGFCEAETLAGALRKILREDAPMALLETYNRQQQDEWRQLLGLSGGLKARPETNPWVRDHSARILPCLPASGGDLVRLAGQLKLDLA